MRYVSVITEFLFGEVTISTTTPNVKLLPEQYDVSLTVKPISPNVAKLESITLIPKAKI